ncbi:MULTISPECIES: adenylate/guanylate cyclase domain-containing protein [unclassified Mycobacterium]|uniref:adenylate/guanylate cyclase domain-containing protein n=1 Tax=unclassified Mycobacterium TaxID=2642494 RepID=UPI0027404760|nr:MULTISPECIES: adenylate/guanylate cyclase domain-containing protein [unclassified Mycobacterium]MDP7705351.1 adenylate/guanylate cyclase domain-containing protein [Mycobacterium sp. TY815]MDP7723423.1 adenylate/guanylate cyclase domain-containing protein [Mycobacterium sp. TY814]
MTARDNAAQRLTNALGTVTRYGIPPPETTSYGSWLLGKRSDSEHTTRIRLQAMLTLVVAVANLIGVGVMLTLIVSVPVPPARTKIQPWIEFLVGPFYLAASLAVGGIWLTSRIVRSLRWAIQGDTPTLRDQRNTLLIPWRLAVFHLVFWGIWTALLTYVYGIYNSLLIPRMLFATGISGLGVATGCYLFAEFALRPVAARALEAGPPPRRLASGIMSRTMTGWLITAAVPTVSVSLLAILDLTLRDITGAQFVRWVILVTAPTLLFGFVLMWVLAWLTATPVRVVRAALKRVEQGDLHSDMVVFDGTELGELQRGFNNMVDGLRQRESVRDLFGRYVGREVAAAAERELPKLGGEERHVAVVFIDIIDSTKLVTSQPPAETVALLNRFFAIIVEQINAFQGLVNKFAGDASLAIFGAPNHLACAENSALAAARSIADRLVNEIPELKAGIGVAAGQVVAGNVGANERFEYTVIGGPVNEAARLCTLAKKYPGYLLASSDAVRGADENESARWRLGESVVLRGYDQPTRLASPVQPAQRTGC